MNYCNPSTATGIAFLHENQGAWKAAAERSRAPEINGWGKNNWKGFRWFYNMMGKHSEDFDSKTNQTSYVNILLKGWRQSASCIYLL